MSNIEQDKYNKDLIPAEIEDSTRINDDVLSTIAGIELTKIKGISATGGGITDFLSRKNPSKGIKVEVNGDRVVFDIAVIVDYGINIPDVSHEIQTKIRKAVSEMTGKFVSAINISVQGIRTNVERQAISDIDDSQNNKKEE